MRNVIVGPDGARMRWVEMGAGGRVHVYLHGLGSSSVTYFAQSVAHPALSGPRSLLLDLLGFGLSDRPRSFGYSLEDHARSVATVLDALEVDAANVVGHSMGGSAAIMLAAQRPDLVNRLVLAEPNLDPSPRPRIEGYTEDEFTADGFGSALASIDSEWAATMRLADPIAVYRSERGLGRGTTPMMRQVLKDLGIPRTVLVGELSDDLDGADELIAAGVSIVPIAGAGHNSMVDNPEDFAVETARAFREPVPDF
ncbi:MAG: alpha/beta hydrolase [Geodermatophilaceae bacterium]|nr:alpha/beta hydrolase [Geodermatophilaceae bacterium]